MTLTTTLLVILFVLLFIIMIIAVIQPTYWSNGGDEEVTTTTTTTTTTTYEDAVQQAQPTLNIVGSLQREFEGSQAFVIDPVDKMKIWLNSNDDMYEDAAGKIWTLR